MAASQMDGYALTQVYYGVRSDKAAIALPASTLGTIFTVAGGRVVITALFGEVTVIIQAQANACKFVSTPTTGTAVDLCATADINGLEVNGRIGLAGALGTAANKTSGGALIMQTVHVLVPAGTIGFNTAATNTGNMKFTCWWFPIDQGATLV